MNDTTTNNTILYERMIKLKREYDILQPRDTIRPIIGAVGDYTYLKVWNPSDTQGLDNTFNAIQQAIGLHVMHEANKKRILDELHMLQEVYFNMIKTDTNHSQDSTEVIE